MNFYYFLVVYDYLICFCFANQKIYIVLHLCDLRKCMILRKFFSCENADSIDSIAVHISLKTFSRSVRVQASTKSACLTNSCPQDSGWKAVGVQTLPSKLSASLLWRHVPRHGQASNCQLRQAWRQKTGKTRLKKATARAN